MKTTNLPLVSVIVPVLNACETLSVCLESLLNIDYPKDRLEIFVVDNGSSDSSVQIAKNLGVMVLHESYKSSYAARNRGILVSKGDLIAFTDADCVVTANWLKCLVAHWSDDRIGCFAGEIKAYNPKSLLEKFSDREGILSQVKTLNCPYLPYTQTANSAYRREVFDRVGLFLQDVTSGGDAEIAWRMQQKLGLLIKFIPQALVYHRHRNSVVGLFRQFKKYEQAKIFWQKYYPDYPVPSIEQRRNELHRCIKWAKAIVLRTFIDFLKGKIDSVTFLTPFLKIVMALATYRCRVESTKRNNVE